MKPRCQAPEPSPPIDFDGKRYISAFEVSGRVGVASSHLVRWASKGVTRQGWPLRGIRRGFEVFLDEECIKRIEDERFRVVPGDKPAGRITLGFTPDKAGYISGAQAAKILGFATSHLVTCCRRAANGKPVRGMEGLEIVRDLLEGNNQYYISEKSVRATFESKISGKGIFRVDRLIDR